MRSIHGIALAAFSAGVAAAPGAGWAQDARQHPAIAALPEIVHIDDGPTEIVVRGDLSPRRAKRMAQLARAVYGDVNRRFVASEGDPERGPVVVCLFDSNRSYRDFVGAVFGDGDHSSMGFYSPSKRIVVANLARSVGNLRHELVHPLVGDDFPGIPAWLNEGLGSLYGTAKRTRGKARAGGRQRASFRFLVNYRLRDLHAADRRGELPTLGDLAQSSHREVRGARAMTYYATARYVLLYLDRRGQLENLYREMKAEPLTAARQRAILDKYVDYDEFLAWARRLRYKRQ